MESIRMDQILDKLKILADSAKYDVSCSSSGVERRNNRKIGSGASEGICHTWSADGRCISLLKVLFTNKCAYDCEYCVNRRSSDARRVSFEPEELARLTIEFYRRNYIEGLFLSSAVEVSPDYTAERILRCLQLLREDYGFAGYIHAKIIPGVSPELVHAIGLVADRLSVNIEMPTSRSLARFAPQKKPKQIFAPMRQITNTLIERNALKGPGTMFQGEKLNSPENYISEGTGGTIAALGQIRKEQNMEEVNGENGFASSAGMLMARRSKKEVFAPAGQTTQMIIGADQETDRQILTTTEYLYHTFKLKRVYYSAYIPVLPSPILPDALAAPPLAREHRLYQADWLLRFYGFEVSEILDDENPNLDTDLDPKIAWALRNLDQFPVEINKAPLSLLLRVPGIGTVSARRIVRQRRAAAVRYEDLKKMGVALKRAKYFLTCSGKFYGQIDFSPDVIKNQILQINDGIQMSMFGGGSGISPAIEEKTGKVLTNG